MIQVLADAAPMTSAGKIITYVMFPLLVGLTLAAVIGGAKAWLNGRARDTATAVREAGLNAQLETHAAALKLLVDSVNPPGGVSLAATMARIDAEARATRDRLTDHIRQSEAFTRTVEERFNGRQSS